MSIGQSLSQVEANPTPLRFYWKFISNDPSDPTSVDIQETSYTISHDHSVLSYRVYTNTDYGTLLCWSDNAVGGQGQEQACQFVLVPPARQEDNMYIDLTLLNGTRILSPRV